MNYTLTLKDRTETVVTEDKAKQIMEMIELKKEFIILDGQMFSRSLIAKIERGGQLPAVNDVFPGAKIESPRYNCVSAGTSIQKMIHEVAMRDKKNWSKLVQDKDWRERTRLAIRAKYPNKKFCDYKQNEHACI